MKTFSICLLLSIAFGGFAQKENHPYCSKRDAFTNRQLKSNSLSVSQISETEKYNVHFYKLDLSMTNQSTTLSGRVEIHAKAEQAIDSALFELFSTLTISQVFVNGTTVTYSRNGSAVKAPVNAQAGQSFVITVVYNGTPPTAATNPLGGAGMSNATSQTWGNKVTWSLSEPFSAYEWWPCKQSLTDKADSCAVNITVPSACKAGSNGVLEQVIDLGNGTTRYEWKHRHPIDYYLISVAVSKYVDYTIYANPVGASNPIPIQNYIYDNPQCLPNFQADIDETADFLELYWSKYGPYPFADEKYGHCMAPFSGGMEHQTMTTQGFFNPTLTAHELAHQWWGNNVTCGSWADIWVNEGFASYSEYVMLEQLYSGDEIQFMQDVHTSVMDQPNGSVYVLDSLNESRIFSGRLTYDKGGAIIHSMRYVVNNDAVFFGALKSFQLAYANGTAKGSDVRDWMANETGIDFTPFFDQWYYGEGYPIYSARWNYTGSDLMLEINHAVSVPAVTPAFTTPLDLRFSRLGQPDTIIRFTITSNSNQYYVPNIGQVTNIVSFDPKNWIVNKVGTKQFDPTLQVSGISEFEQAEIVVYPNPTTSSIQFRFPTDEPHQVNLINLQGQLVRSEQLTKGETMDIAELSGGIYSCEVYCNGMKVAVKKISIR
jgi:aminopeptidase N